MWALILFREDNDHDVIPSSWIRKNKNQCWFPQGRLSHISSLVKNNVPPQEEWEIMDISIIENDIDDYNTALKMMVRAAKTLPLFSDDERGRGLRQKKPKKVVDEIEMDESEDQDNEGSNKRNVPDMSKFNKQKTKVPCYPLVPQSYSQTIEHSRPNSPLNIPLAASNCLQSSTASSYVVPPHQNGNTKCGIKAKHSCTFEDSNDLLVCIARQLCKLSVDVTKMKAHLKYLREDANEKALPVEEQEVLEEDIFFLPVKTEEELQSMESQLSNPTNLKKMIKTLGHQAEGKSMPKIVGSIMTRIISNKLASTYSWKGQKLKKCFKDTELAKAGIAAILNKCPSEPRQDVIKSIQLWLAQSPTRCKRADEVAQRAAPPI